MAWKKLIGLGLIGACVGYLRARARHHATPDALPVAGEMLMDVGIVPVDPEPMAQHSVGPRNPEARP